MKRLFIAGLMMALFASYGYAGMDGMQGKMGHGHEMAGNQKSQMMGDDQMKSGMMDMMHQMQGVMGDMEGMMKNMTPEKMQRMCKMMKGMSGQMMDMSKMMEKGAVSQKEMDMMYDKMADLQKGVSEIK